MSATIRASGGRVRCVALLDQVLRCEVEIHYLADGSINPIVRAVLSYMYENGIPISVETITAGLGGRGVHGQHVVSTVLAALKRMGHVGCVEESESTPLFFPIPEDVSKNDLLSTPVREARIVETLQYCPPGRILAKKIGWEDTEFVRSAFPVCDLPVDHDLYSASGVASNIRASCRGYYLRKGIAPRMHASSMREEYLQRTQLLSVQASYVDGFLLGLPKKIGRYVIHRCYVFGYGVGEDSRIRVEVRRFPLGPENVAYSTRLNERIRQDSWIASVLDRASQDELAVVDPNLY